MQYQELVETFFIYMQVASLKRRQELLENLYFECPFENLQDRIADEVADIYQKRMCGRALLLLPSKLESVTEITVNHVRS